MWISVSPLILLSGIVCGGLVAGCTDARQESGPPTAPEAALTATERSKIDGDLLRLEGDSVQVTDIPSTRRPDGTRAYAVRVQTSDVEALQKAGVPTDSAADGTVWARLSLAEIRGVAQMDVVTSIQADNEPLPRGAPGHQ